MVDIKAFYGYKINEFGEVYSYKYSDEGKKVPHHLTINGYVFVPLWKGGKQYNRTIHRLLAIHFIPNPKNLPVINHIDGNKQNFSLSNLEWCTQQHNVRQAFDNGKRKITKEQAEIIRKKYATGLFLQKELAKENNISRSQVSHIIRGFSWN